MEYKFRDLKKEEIDVRVATLNADKGVTLLLYKDARVDMDILDETVGAMNWQRKHLRDNRNCIIEIWDESKGQWISKEDTGTESFSEAEKGLASDSFKRAGFNWGIGRELYTSPFIFVKADDVNIRVGKTGRETTYDKFVVSHIKIKDKQIIELEITNTNRNKVVFKFPVTFNKEESKLKPATEEQKQEILKLFTEQELMQRLKCKSHEILLRLNTLSEISAKKLIMVGRNKNE